MRRRCTGRRARGSALREVAHASGATLPYVSRAARPSLTASVCVLEHAHQCRDERIRVAAWNQDAVDAVGDDVRDPARVRADDHASARERLEHDTAEPLRIRRENERPGGSRSRAATSTGGSSRCARPGREGPRPVGRSPRDASLGRRPSSMASGSRCATRRHAAARPSTFLYVLERADEHNAASVGDRARAADRERPPGRCRSGSTPSPACPRHLVDERRRERRQRARRVGVADARARDGVGGRRDESARGRSVGARERARVAVHLDAPAVPASAQAHGPAAPRRRRTDPMRRSPRPERRAASVRPRTAAAG